MKSLKENPKLILKGLAWLVVLGVVGLFIYFNSQPARLDLWGLMTLWIWSWLLWALIFSGGIATGYLFFRYEKRFRKR
jgi:hypothetical protein